MSRIGTDYTGSCKSNSHTITTTAAPLSFNKVHYLGGVDVQ
jgi:hypothetical protein